MTPNPATEILEALDEVRERLEYTATIALRGEAGFLDVVVREVRARTSVADVEVTKNDETEIAVTVFPAAPKLLSQKDADERCAYLWCSHITNKKIRIVVDDSKRLGGGRRG